MLLRFLALHALAKFFTSVSFALSISDITSVMVSLQFITPSTRVSAFMIPASFRASTTKFLVSSDESMMVWFAFRYSVMISSKASFLLSLEVFGSATVFLKSVYPSSLLMPSGIPRRVLVDTVLFFFISE